MSDGSGRLGKESPVLGIVHFASSDLSLERLSNSSAEDEEEGESPKELGSTSLSGSGGDNNGLEFVRRSSTSLQKALMISSSTTTRQRTFSPLLFAVISHNSCVYCTICSKLAIRLYVGDFCVQKPV